MLDRYRWRRRFAWLPKAIGTKSIWLEQYAWREVPHDEAQPVFKTYPPSWPVQETREYVIRKSGYTAWRFSGHFPMVLWGGSYHAWMEEPYVRRASLASVHS